MYRVGRPILYVYYVSDLMVCLAFVLDDESAACQVTETFLLLFPSLVHSIIDISLLYVNLLIPADWTAQLDRCSRATKRMCNARKKLLLYKPSISCAAQRRDFVTRVQICIYISARHKGYSGSIALPGYIYIRKPIYCR